MGYKAFIPNSLAPVLNWTTQLVNTLSRADFLLGKLAREGRKLANLSLLIKPFVTREAVLSSKIEGTQAALGEMLAANAGIPVQRDPIAYSTAQRGMQKLEQAKIIKQINSSKRDKVYCATEIIDILEEPARID